MAGTSAPKKPYKKILVVGDVASGKTELVQSGLPADAKTPFSEAYTPSTAITIRQNDNTRQFIYDTSDSPFYKPILHSYYPETDVFILCCDLSRENAWDTLALHIAKIREHGAAHTPIIIAATKADLVDSHNDATVQNNRTMLESISRLHQLPVIECSAKTGLGIQALFNSAATINILSEKLQTQLDTLWEQLNFEVDKNFSGFIENNPQNGCFFNCRLTKPGDKNIKIANLAVLTEIRICLASDDYKTGDPSAKNQSMLNTITKTLNTYTLAGTGWLPSRTMKLVKSILAAHAVSDSDIDQLANHRNEKYKNLNPS